MIFSAIKTSIRDNLNDAGVTFYTATDLDDSMQDAYDEVFVLSQCRVRKTTVNFADDTNYYSLIDSITDYLGTVAIFNNNTNLWLRDDINAKDLDQMRYDWELWYGEAQFWFPLNNWQYIGLVPKSLTGSGNFTVYYWSTAPTVVDTETPLIATDMQNSLLENYCTADLLEQAEEFKKAAEYWTKFFESLVLYTERVKNVARPDFIHFA